MKAVLAFLLVTAYLSTGQSIRTTVIHKVVIEINSPDRETWDMALKNIANLQKSFGRNHLEVEAVALGKGLNLVLRNDTEFADRLKGLNLSGVVFAACQNTMHQRNLKKEDLLPFVMTVDSGVAEIVRKQEAGWSYLKSGS